MHMKEFYIFCIIFSGSIVTLIFSIIQDSMGRKKIMIFTFIFLFFGFIFLFFFHTLGTQIFALMLFWGYKEIIYSIELILSNELLVNPIRKHSLNLYSIIACIGGILGNFLTYYLVNYINLHVILFLGFFLFTLMIFFFIPESPSYLLKHSKIDKLKKVILNIAKTNKIPEQKINLLMIDLDLVIKSKILFPIYLKDDQRDSKKKKELSVNISYWKYFSNKRACLYLIGLCFFGGLHYFNYYSFVLLSEKLKSFSIQGRLFVILCAKILGRMTMIVVLIYSNRKFLNYFISITIFIFSSLILIFSYVLKEETLNFIGMIFTGIL